jgi:hypothetical protein
VAVGVIVGVDESVAVGVTVGIGVAVRVAVVVGIAVGVAVRVGVGVTVGVAVRVAVGVAVITGGAVKSIVNFGRVAVSPFSLLLKRLVTFTAASLPITIQPKFDAVPLTHACTSATRPLEDHE